MHTESKTFSDGERFEVVTDDQSVLFLTPKTKLIAGRFLLCLSDIFDEL